MTLASSNMFENISFPKNSNGPESGMWRSCFSLSLSNTNVPALGFHAHTYRKLNKGNKEMFIMILLKILFLGELYSQRENN